MARGWRCGLDVFCAALLILAVLVLPITAAAREERPGRTGAVRMVVAGDLIGVLVTPPDRPPTGLVLLLPDGFGHDQRGAPYIDQLLGAGVAVLDLLRGGDDPAVIAATLPALAASVGTGGVPIGLLGFGMGGRVALGLGAPGIAARVLLYPGCGDLVAAPPVATAGAMLLLHGEADPTNRPADCEALAARLSREGGGHVRRLSYPAAGYAWDYPAFGSAHRIALPRPDGAGRATVEPWPDLAAMSAAQAAGFLLRELLAASSADAPR